MPSGLSIGSAMLLGAAGSTLLGSLMAPDKPAAQQAADIPAPEVTPPTPMPTPNDKAIGQAAKTRSIIAQQQRRGRASTILSDQSVVADPLGA